MPRKKVTPEIVEMVRYMRREGESVRGDSRQVDLPYKTVLRLSGEREERMGKNGPEIVDNQFAPFML